MKKLNLWIGHYTGWTLRVPCKTRCRTGYLGAIRGVFDARSRRARMLESGCREGAVRSQFSPPFAGVELACSAPKLERPRPPEGWWRQRCLSGTEAPFPPAYALFAR